MSNIMEEVFEHEHRWESAKVPKFPNRVRCKICGAGANRESLMGFKYVLIQTCYTHGNFVELSCPQCDPTGGKP